MSRWWILLPLLMLLGIQAKAGGFPGRQVTIMSPYQAGGTSDIIARAIARRLATTWSYPVVVENRPGANGSIGIQAVMRAPADGHTLLAIASSALTLNPLIYSSLPYQVHRDLAPVTRTGQVTNVLVTTPSVPARTVHELIVLARDHPGDLKFASQGIGSNGHLNGELFRIQAGIDLLHVPYKGSAPAVTDLIGGQVQLMFDNLPSVLGQIKAGTLRALAVTSAVRSPQLPDVPTMREAGVTDFNTTAWFAVLVARNTPDEVRTVLETAIENALADPEVRSRLSDAGVEPLGRGATDLEESIDTDTAMWRGVVSAARIKVD